MPIAEYSSRDSDFVVLGSELFFAVGKRERNFCHTHGLFAVSSAEDDICHFAPSQRFCRLLAKYPANGVQDIRLSATVWPDDRSYTGMEIQNGFMSERLKSNQFERLKGGLIDDLQGRLASG